MDEEIDLLLAGALLGKHPEWPADWCDGQAEAVWDRVRFHGIAFPLGAQLPGAIGWPQALLDQIREEAQMQAFWEESHRGMLVRLFARLAEARIEGVLMKGTALAYSVYAEPAARRRGDTDLLVRAADLANVREILRASGFERKQDPHGLFFQESWLFDTGIGLIHAIDLHWQPSDSPALQTVLRADEFFASAIQLPRLAPAARASHPVLTFLHGAVNQAWHATRGYLVDDERLDGTGRLIWAWDNHLLTREFGTDEWGRLVHLAVEREIAPVCLTALDLAVRHCGASVPEAVRKALQDAPQETDLVDHLRDTNLITSFVTDLRRIPSFRAKAAFVYGHALPSGDHLRMKYPASASWPMPILQLRRIGEAALRWFSSQGRR